MNILSIGNSFSEDAQAYLYRIAHAEGVAMKNVNLFIGGCSLERHFRNMMGNRKEYDFDYNGFRTGLKVSIDDALCLDQWDVVTLQQSSPNSFKYETFVPYIDELAAHVRKFAPQAKIMIHETWGYATGSDRLQSMGFETMEEMSEKVFAAYAKAAKHIGADGIIPAGEGLLRLAEETGKPVHRDGFHAHRGIGRYLLGCVWFDTLTGHITHNDSYSDFDAETAPEDAALARRIAEEVTAGRRL